MLRVMNLKSIKRNEQGLVSIITTLVMMSLLTLIAIGYANLANREQRQATDQQLNTQAFYAAESGINEAIKHNSSFNADTCTSGSVGSDSNVSYSCVLVNNTVPNIKYDNGIEPSENVVTPIIPTEALSTLTISWENKNEPEVFVDNCDHKLLSSAEWSSRNRTGILRTMLIPGAFSDRADLVNRTDTFFLYPTSEGSSGGVGCVTNVSSPIADYRDDGKFVDGACSNTPENKTPPTFHKCVANISVNIPQNQTYYLRLKPIYGQNLRVTISGSGVNGPVRFSGAQMEIDSTGKVADVLRRLQVRVPLFKDTNPDVQYATETSDSLCKRLFVYPGGASTDVSLNNPPGATNEDASVCSPTY